MQEHMERVIAHVANARSLMRLIRAAVSVAVVPAVMMLNQPAAHAGPSVDGMIASSDDHFFFHGRAELVSKEGGTLFSFYNNGYNNDDTVNWGPKVAIGSGWGAVASAAVYLADLDGDSRAEIISKENGLLFGFHNDGYDYITGTVNWGSKVLIGSGWGAVANAAVYLADLDGDGRADLISKENGTIFAFHNDWYNRDGTVIWGRKVAIASGWGAVANAAVYFADLDGDGLAELISKENGVLFAFHNFYYDYSTGTVNWEPKVAIGSGWSAVPDAAVKFADLDGDRLAELISKENGLLFGFHNNGYDLITRTVNWGSKVLIGSGWSAVPDTAVKVADISGI